MYASICNGILQIFGTFLDLDLGSLSTNEIQNHLVAKITANYLQQKS